MSKYNVDNGLLMDRKDRLAAKRSALRFFYDPSEKTVLGRTAKSWAQIIVFYIIFYLVLSALFAFCMWVFYQTLDPRIPKWKLDQSLIGTNPVYRRPGLTPGKGQNIYNCDYLSKPGPGQVCNVDIRNWFPCTVENDFNYHKAAPCIFLKLNKVYGWIPEFYNSTNDLPEQMPLELKKHIREVARSKPHELNTVWVTCEGENPADIENLGPVTYIPRHGFPGYYFPYENSEGYLSPLTAIHISSPRSGIIINIECKAWAKNIKHSRQDRLGSVHLELMID